MRVLITGGAGFIGTNLRKELEAEPEIDKIAILDDLSSGSEENLTDLSSKTEFILGSILDSDLLFALIQSVDCVVHLAARPSVSRSIEDPAATTQCNVNGTFNVLEGIRRSSELKHLIFASSSSVYGANSKLPKSETDVCRPVSPYAASKLSGETYALAYQKSFQIPVTAFRFFNVYGPHQQPNHAYAAVIPAFLFASLHQKPIPVHGDGRQTRDFTYVGTLTSVIREAIIRRTTHDTPVNLAFGTRCSLLDLISEIGSLFKLDPQIEHLAPRLGDVRDSQADNSLLRRLFPEIDPIPLSVGLSLTASWMQEIY